MIMTVGEIRRDYKAAKDRKAHIDILADRNQCRKADIICILVGGGKDAVMCAEEVQGILDGLHKDMDGDVKRIQYNERRYKEFEADIKAISAAYKRPQEGTAHE